MAIPLQVMCTHRKMRNELSWHLKNAVIGSRFDHWTQRRCIFPSYFVHAPSRQTPANSQPHWISKYFFSLTMSSNSDQIQYKVELIHNQPDLLSICLSSNFMKEKGKWMPQFCANRIEWNQLKVLPGTSI